jgi:flagellar assembly protein FliH
MTVSALLLESFDNGAHCAVRDETAQSPATAADLEAERLAAYESGYRSGWDDCLAADEDMRRRVGAELARNLADLGFTYHEARAQLLSETETLLETFFRTVCPRSAGPAVVRRLIDDVLDLAAETLDLPVEIVASPADAATVRALLPETTFPLSLVEESALAEGQAHLRFGRSERVYDMTHIADRLCEAIAARPGRSGERTQHGE